jgi:hypothetical protein
MDWTDYYNALMAKLEEQLQVNYDAKYRELGEKQADKGLSFVDEIIRDSEKSPADYPIGNGSVFTCPSFRWSFPDGKADAVELADMVTAEG